MANIHTFSQMRDSANNNNSQRNVSYAPLGFSQGGQNQRGPPILGLRSSPGDDTNPPTIGIVDLLFPKFKFKSFIFIISCIQIVMYLATTLISLTMEKEDDAYTCLLFKFGAKYTPSIVVSHQVQRLILPVLLHANFVHVFYNLLSQFFYGFRLEEYYGTKKLMALYLTAGLAGNLLSAIRETENISVGASSALFGLFALMIIYLVEDHENLGARKNFAIILLVVLILAGLVSGNQAKNVDNSSHLGGLVMGGLIGVFYMERQADPKFYQKKYIAAGIIALFFIATSISLATLETKDPKGLEDGCNKMLPF